MKATITPLLCSLGVENNTSVSRARSRWHLGEPPDFDQVGWPCADFQNVGICKNRCKCR